MQTINAEINVKQSIHILAKTCGTVLSALLLFLHTHTHKESLTLITGKTLMLKFEPHSWRGKQVCYHLLCFYKATMYYGKVKIQIEHMN